MKLENAKSEISIKTRQYEQFKEIQTSSIDINKLKQQIEEERSKFAQIMTNWAQEVTKTIHSVGYSRGSQTFFFPLTILMCNKDQSLTTND